MKVVHCNDYTLTPACKWFLDDYPDCQRLVNKQTEALITAVKALELSEKYGTKATERWAAQYQPTPGSTRFKKGTWQ
jgi:hypothetical protein